jgi:hypothetical protein
MYFLYSLIFYPLLCSKTYEKSLKINKFLMPGFIFAQYDIMVQILFRARCQWKITCKPLNPGKKRFGYEYENELIQLEKDPIRRQESFYREWNRTAGMRASWAWGPPMNEFIVAGSPKASRIT